VCARGRRGALRLPAFFVAWVIGLVFVCGLPTPGRANTTPSWSNEWSLPTAPASLAPASTSTSTSTPAIRALALPANAPRYAADVARPITQADFCRHDGDAIPDASCDWRPVPLAYVWRGSRTERMSDGWFRLHFTLGAVPAQGVALYVVAFNRSGRLFVNDRYVREFGSMHDPLPMNWNRSQFAVMPPALLHEGDNVIEIQQRVYYWENGWLAPVQVGSEETLRPLYERRRFWQNDLVRILGATTAATGMFMLGVWLGRRAQAMYFWFGLGALLWTVISLDYFAIVAPLEARAWENFMEAAQVLRAVLVFVFVLRYCGRRMPRLEAALWIYLAAGSALLFAHAIWGLYVDLWYFGTLVASPYFFYILVREGLRRGPMEGSLLGLAGSAQIALSGYDLWLFSQHSWTDHVYLAHFSEPILLFVVGWILIQRFIESLNAYEKLAGVLEQRVAAKAAELERNYEQLVEARRNEALALERTRIMSEMHDGIGSQLTMALSLVRSIDGLPSGEDGRVATVLRESIEDLQLIIDSLEPVENDLLTVLGTLRYRLQDRLSKSGIALHWNVVDLPPLPMLTPHSVLSILRILQEAFANCLKHSGATRIVVSTGLSGALGIGETACITIRDDGCGIDGTRAGRGLENMRRRAEALGGRLTIASRPGSTEVLLEVPTLRHPT
jgi:signal transduction histidine kinase